MSPRWLAAVAALAIVTGGRVPAAADSFELAVETSVIAPVFRGASLSGRLRTFSLPHYALGAGISALSLPQVLVDGSSDNELKGWHVDLRPSGYVSVDYFVEPDGTGFAAGIALGVARYTLTSEIVSGRTSYVAVYALPRAAYTWFVTDSLYLEASVGLQLDAKVSGSTQLSTRRFVPFAVLPQANLNVGYLFAR